jgi:putative ABC transport system substrate-binding protein
MKRREFITLLGGAAAAWPLAARAQQPDRMQRIGVLMGGFVASDPEGQARITAFQRALQDLGWTDGRSFQIDYRWAPKAELIQSHAKELVEWKPEVILASTTPAVAALMRAGTIPIVFVQVNDPVGQGLVQSLSKPGGHVTGFTAFEFSLGSKWLRFLKRSRLVSHESPLSSIPGRLHFLSHSCARSTRRLRHFRWNRLRPPFTTSPRSNPPSRGSHGCPTGL